MTLSIAVVQSECITEDEADIQGMTLPSLTIFKELTWHKRSW